MSNPGLKFIIKLNNNNNNTNNNTNNNITPSPLKRSAYDNTFYSFDEQNQENDDDVDP
jgi:hypothetical protein